VSARIELAGRCHLDRRFLRGEGREDLVVAERLPPRADVGPELREDAALPVDERAVAVEGQRLEFGEIHRSPPYRNRPFICGSCGIFVSEAMSPLALARLVARSFDAISIIV